MHRAGVTRPWVLGSFELTELLGVGGMAEVWQGRHLGSDAPVAVKVLSPHLAGHPSFEAAFHEEIRAAARLDHPNVVTILDIGRAGTTEASASGGRIVEGTPFLAMELCSGGSFATAPNRPASWAALREVVTAVLSALAHAHGRGLVHRDIKPGNLLRARPTDVRTGTMITDFGLADAGDRARVLRGICGTPRYMAPEQFRNDDRAIGPWTDLYALGCVVYEWITGDPPFRAETIEELSRAHRREPPPALVPLFPVPDGTGEWVATLLDKHPIGRFQRAADAVWALDQIGDAPTSHEVSSNTPNRLGLVATTEGGQIVPDLSVGESSEVEVIVDLDDVQAEPTRTLQRAPAPVAPIPRSWSEGPVTGPAVRLAGAGLGLLELRQMGMVDRDEERDLLWRRLRAVAATQQPHGVVLRGPQGVGKSRLALWLAERAHELGAAEVLRAAHNPLGGRSDGIVNALARWLRCADLRGDALFDHLERRLLDAGVADPEEARALGALLDENRLGWVDGRDQAPGGPGLVRFGSTKERWIVLRRALERAARFRPVILWLDDAHWGHEAVAFTRWLLHEGAIRVLVVLCACDEVLAARPHETAALDELAELSNVEDVVLEALAPEHRPVLVRRLLGLEAQLATEVEQRTAGHPLFAIQLVGDWVQRGLLEPGPEGFRLRDGAVADVPETLHELWRRRLDRVVGLPHTGARQALELAAVLGREVDDTEWRDLCRLAGVQPPSELVFTLLSRRLAWTTDVGWAFAHALLRDCVESTAADEGRLARHHRAAADLLAPRVAVDTTAAARRVRHLVRAGSFEIAVDDAINALEPCLRRSDLNLATEIADAATDAVERLGLRPDDPRRARLGLLRARLALRRRNTREALELARTIEAEARQHGWPRELAGALRLQGQAEEDLNNLFGAEALDRAALELFTELDDAAGVVDCLSGLGYLARLSGDLPGAAAHYERALALREAIEDLEVELECLQGWALVLKLQGHVRRATSVFEEALVRARRVGDRAAMAACSNGLGEVARERGLYDEAAGHYRQAVELYESLGSRRDVVPRINLALVLIARRRYSDARPLLEAALAFLESREHDTLAGCVHAALLPCVAHHGSWPEWDHHLTGAARLLDATGVHDPDVAWCLELGAQIAWVGRNQMRSRTAYRLARAQWERLGFTDRVAAVDEVLGLFNGG